MRQKCAKCAKQALCRPRRSLLLRDHHALVTRRDEKEGAELRRALIAARVAAGLTQVQLAERLGTTQSAV